MLTVHELGWHMEDAWTILDGTHNRWDIRELAPLEILRRAERVISVPLSLSFLVSKKLFGINACH